MNVTEINNYETFIFLSKDNFLPRITNLLLITTVIQHGLQKVLSSEFTLQATDQKKTELFSLPVSLTSSAKTMLRQQEETGSLRSPFDRKQREKYNVSQSL